jgi:hypothetical protein
MKRQWLPWILSTVLFCLAAIIIVSASSAEEQTLPIPENRSRITHVSGLPPAEFSEQASLAVTQPNDIQASQDFVYTGRLAATTDYQPYETIAFADPSNYGERYPVDAYGQPANQEFIAVIHETVGSAMSAINLFQTPHPRDQDQVSYHALIARDGTIVYIVPPEKRAFGAGNSVFNGPQGPETVVTNPAFPPSVNNFAYHVSLESPADGRGNRSQHSGYTEAQYHALAWLLARSNIPDGRITTHQAVDRSGTRRDPRSFDRTTFLSLLHQYRQGQA